ncbi:hypothetical protein BDR04DRAFT_1090644 [Suillus decipiens]|nr:hypothetical protein BDR04DRAFT_1090644 [Suillus decipiens]
MSLLSTLPTFLKRLLLFLRCLDWHLPRPTSLTPAIFNIVKNSPARWYKACCLYRLGSLYITLSQYREAMKAFKAAEAPYLTAGSHEMVANCVITFAEICRC